MQEAGGTSIQFLHGKMPSCLGLDSFVEFLGCARFQFDGFPRLKVNGF